MKYWEPLEYVGELLVFFGVVGEVFAEWREPHRKRFAKASSVVLVIGLALSLASLIGTNEHFNDTIAFLNLKSSQADERASKNEDEAAKARAANIKLGIELQKEEQQTAEAEKEAALANAKLGGWKLSDAARARVAAKLAKFSGTHFELSVNPVETPFMESLAALMVSPSVGWVEDTPKAPEGSIGQILIDNKASISLTTGIGLEVDRDQVSLKPALVAFGTAIHKELGAERIPVYFAPPRTYGDRIHIIIGKRQ